MSISRAFRRRKRRVHLAKLEAAQEALTELQAQVGREHVSVQGAIAILIETVSLVLEGEIQLEGELQDPGAGS